MISVEFQWKKAKLKKKTFAAKNSIESRAVTKAEKDNKGNYTRAQ